MLPGSRRRRHRRCPVGTPRGSVIRHRRGAGRQHEPGPGRDGDGISDGLLASTRARLTLPASTRARLTQTPGGRDAANAAGLIPDLRSLRSLTPDVPPPAAAMAAAMAAAQLLPDLIQLRQGAIAILNGLRARLQEGQLRRRVCRHVHDHHELLHGLLCLGR